MSMQPPLKAFLFSQLKPKFSGYSVPASGHEVIKMEFIDYDKQIKIGFYKELDEDSKNGSYPALLAKYSVAASVLIRLCLGEKAAEDRLVFNDNGEIVGTVSININNYKPLNCYAQLLPNNPHERELVCPSPETLLRYNVAELLINAWRMKCDDRHPGNFSLFGLIDWDMTLYPYTYIMRGKRLVDGIVRDLPEKSMRLSIKDLDNFPNIENRTHTPTNSIPKNGNFFKRFQAYAAFQKLAQNHCIQVSKKRIYWQEQFFAACLKELLTFDIDLLKIRLQQYLGNELLLDYLALAKEKSDQLAKVYPELFNAATNHIPFIEHILELFKREYKEFYFTVVHYPGCQQNKSGVPVISFSNFLRNKPSVFQSIKKWIMHENKKIEYFSEKYKKIGKKNKQGTDITLEFYISPVQSYYNLQKVEQLYHQIWRDAHGAIIYNFIKQGKKLLQEFVSITDNKIKFITIETKEEPNLLFIVNQADTNQKNLLNKSQLISQIKTNKEIIFIKKWKKFIYDLEKYTRQYYILPANKLDPKHNQMFCDAVAKLVNKFDKYHLPIIGNAFTEKFNLYKHNLQQFYNGLNFQRHLFSKDYALYETAPYNNITLLAYPHTDLDVVRATLHTLFEWVNLLPPETFNKLILNTIDEYYQPNFYNILAKRYRSFDVAAYLETTNEDCASRLSAILSEGGTEGTSLNTNLLKNLILMMIKSTPLSMDINLLSIQNALALEEFQAEFYAQKAQEYVIKKGRAALPVSKIKIARYGDLLFKWIEQQHYSLVHQLIREAVHEYKPLSLNFWSSRMRQHDVLLLLNTIPRYSNTILLAMILNNGENNINSLNTILLNKLTRTIKADVNWQEKANLIDFNIINDALVSDLSYFGKQLKDYTKSILSSMSDHNLHNAICFM